MVRLDCALCREFGRFLVVTLEFCQDVAFMLPYQRAHGRFVVSTRSRVVSLLYEDCSGSGSL